MHTEPKNTHEMHTKPKNTHGCTRIHTPRKYLGKYTRQGKIHTEKIHTEYTRQFAPRLGQTQIHTEIHTDAHGCTRNTHANTFLAEKTKNHRKKPAKKNAHGSPHVYFFWLSYAREGGRKFGA